MVEKENLTDPVAPVFWELWDGLVALLSQVGHHLVDAFALMFGNFHP
jgi:hypothetical protein